MLNKLSFNLMNELNESDTKTYEVKKKVFTENTYLNENCKELKEDIDRSSKAEQALLDLIQTSSSDYTLDNVQMERTPEGNWHIITLDGKDIVTVDKDFFGEDALEDLRLNGYIKDNIDEAAPIGMTDEDKKDKEDRLASLKTQLEKDGDQLAADEREAIEKEIAELEKELADTEILNEKPLEESAPGTDAYDKLVQGDDVYFRNDEGVALLGHYADNYPEPEEYDEGYKPEYGGTEEGLQKAKEAAANRDVWEFMEVFEDTLQPMNEIYAYVYGQDELMEMLKTLRQVNVIKKLEEDQIDDARKDSKEKGLVSEECDKSLKEDSYDSGIFYEIEQAFEEAGLNPVRFIDDGILTRNIGWTVSSNGQSQQISCDGSWYDEEEDDLDESEKSLKEGYVEAFGGDAEDFVGDMEYMINELKPIAMNAFGTHLAQQMIEDFMETCERQLAKGKRLASGDEFYSESEEPAGRKMTKAEFAKEFGEGCDVEVINAGREPEERIEIVDECDSNKIEEAEVTNLKMIKNQGNVYMLEDDNKQIIVGENYNESEGLIENAEIYKSKESADKDYLGRCGIDLNEVKAEAEENQ